MSNNKNLVFLNQPINETNKDFITVSTYVDKIDCAINSGVKNGSSNFTFWRW